MSVPTAHMTALAAKALSLGRWLEIEGLPYAYGTFTETDVATFFSNRGAAQRPLGIKPYLKERPRSIDQQIDTLQGGGQTIGSIEFQLADIDGTIAQLLGVGYQTGFTALSAEINATVTTIPYPNGGGAGFTNGGYCYIGSETIKIGTVGATSFTGCTRGYFNSKPQAFGIGIPIGTRPYTMANRRCWYRQVATAGSPGSLHGAAKDDESCVRLVGLLDDMVLGETPATWKLSVHTMDEELDRKVFRGLRQFPLQSIVMSDRPFDDDSDEGPGQIQIAGYPWYNVNQFNVANDTHWAPPLTEEGLPLFDPGEYFLVRIDDEIFQCIGLASGRIQFQARALLGTKPEKHTYGANVKEIISVIENAAVIGMEIASKFTAVPPAGLHADHPLVLILQILMSTGAGTNYSGAGTNYDVLPESWGLGIDYSRVDIAGIEVAAQEEPTLRFGGITDAPANFLAMSRELLAFSGYYHYVAIGDLYRIKRLRPPEPDAQESTVRTIDDSVRIGNAKPMFEPNWSGAVREVVYQYAWDILRSQFKVIDIYKLAGGDLYSKGKARTIEYTSKLLYAGRSGVPGEPPFQRFDIHAWLQSRAEFFKVRYGRPPPIVRERVTYDFLDVEPGDLVFVTSDSLPSTTTGALGMNEEVGEVISVSINDETHTVQLTILMTGWQLGSYRYIGPSLEIESRYSLSAGDAGIIFVANRFTELTGATGAAQNDCLLDTTKGQIFPFSNNHAVDGRLWAADFSSYQDIQIFNDDAATGSLTIQASSGLWTLVPIAGMFITHSEFQNHFEVMSHDYSGVVEEIMSFSAFAAGSDDILGADNIPAHKLFPS